jgi:mRNA interferase HigB
MMRLLRQDLLVKAIQRHADVKDWLDAWATTVVAANWESLGDVREDYPSADGVKLKSRIVVTVFNVKGNEYRLLTSINYSQQAVVILDVLTHAEYSKARWKERY